MSVFGSIAGWRTYATARGDSAPTDASDEDATAALTRASDYIRYSYVAHFSAAYDETAENVETATYEAALLELSTPGFFSATYTPDQQKVLTEVKGIKWTVKEAKSEIERDDASPVSTRIEAMLRPYMTRRNRVSIGIVGP